MNALVLALSLVAAPPAPERLAAADAAIAGDNVAAWEAAVATYEEALAADPNSYDLTLKVAHGLNQIMGSKSHAGGFGIGGISEDAADRAVCQKLAPRADALADRAAAERPGDVRALFARSVAYAYRAASFGIIEAIARGTVGKIKSNAQAIIDVDPSFDSGAGYFTLGIFNTLAPWPVGSNDDAADYFTLALQANPRSMRNHYGQAVLFWRRGDKPAARTEFRRVGELPCGAPAEKPLCDFYRAESQRVLALPD